MREMAHQGGVLDCDEPALAEDEKGLRICPMFVCLLFVVVCPKADKAWDRGHNPSVIVPPIPGE